MKDKLIPLIMLFLLVIMGLLNLLTGNIFWLEVIMIVFFITFYYYIVKKEIRKEFISLSKRFERVEEKFEKIEKLLEKEEEKLERDVNKLISIERKVKRNA